MAQESNRFCSQCGEQLEQGANFCAHCGTATSGQESADSAPQSRSEPRPPFRPTPTFSGSVKSTDHIKYRNMAMQVVLVIMTLGIYALYWFYVTLDELHKSNGNSEGSGFWTILSLIPFIQYFAYWHYANSYTEFVDERYPAITIFIVWVIFSPAVWFLVQSDLNKIASSEEYSGSITR